MTRRVGPQKAASDDIGDTSHEASRQLVFTFLGRHSFSRAVNVVEKDGAPAESAEAVHQGRSSRGVAFVICPLENETHSF